MPVCVFKAFLSGHIVSLASAEEKEKRDILGGKKKIKK